MQEKTRVLLVGETWVVLKFHIKGFDLFPIAGYEDYGVWFVEALSKFDDIELVHMPNHVALGSFPDTLEKLNEYDVVILSDCGKNTLQMYPNMFAVPMGADRLDIIKQYVENGKAFIMIGGYGSFQGLRGIPGYHDTVIEEILPVEIQQDDDRMEKPQGVRPEVVIDDHPVFTSIPDEWPLFLGYNRVKPKNGAQLLAKFEDDPFITVWDYQKGKTMAFTSDLSRHWGTAFVDWEGYGKFWHNTVKYLSGK